MGAHKYHAKTATAEGIVFASKAEAARYQELRLLEVGGAIAELELQPAYVLQPAFKDAAGQHHRAIRYVADFRYRDCASGRVVVEDVKGVETREFRIKHKLLMFRFPTLDFRIV